MRHRLLSTLALLLVGHAGAHVGHAGAAFHAHDLPTARRFAAEEARMVLVHAERDGGLPWYQWPTAEARRRMDVLVREAVVLELDLVDDAGAAAELGIDAPGFLLLDEQGTPLWRHAGSLSLEAFLDRTSGWFGGEDALARAERALVSKGADDPLTRERYAAALVGVGRLDEGLAAYLDLAQQAVAAASPAAVVRRGRVLDALAQLGRSHAPARAALEAAAVQAAELLHAEDAGDPRLAADLGAALELAGRHDRVLALFDELAAANPARVGLFDLVFDDLLEAGRYAEVLQLIEPRTGFAGEAALARRTLVTRPALALQGSGRGTFAFALERGMGLVEALAGTGADREARALTQEVLALSTDRRHTRAALRSRLVRAGSELATELEGGDR